MRGPNRSNDGTLKFLYKNLSRRYIVEKIVTTLLKLNSKNLFRSLLKTIFVRMRLKRKVIIKSLHQKNDEIKLFRLIKNSSLSFKAKVKTLPFFFLNNFWEILYARLILFKKDKIFALSDFFSAKNLTFDLRKECKNEKWWIKIQSICYLQCEYSKWKFKTLIKFSF